MNYTLRGENAGCGRTRIVPIIFLSTMILFHSCGVSVSAADPPSLGECWSGRNEYQWSSWGNSGRFSLLVPTSRLNAFTGFNALGFTPGAEMTWPAERYGWRVIPIRVTAAKPATVTVKDVAIQLR